MSTDGWLSSMRVELEALKGYDTSNSSLSIVPDRLSEVVGMGPDSERSSPSISESRCSSRYFVVICGARKKCAKDHRADDASAYVLLPNSVGDSCSPKSLPTPSAVYPALQCLIQALDRRMQVIGRD